VSPTPHSTAVNTAPHCTALHCTALYYTALHCTALHVGTMEAVAGAVKDSVQTGVKLQRQFASTATAAVQHCNALHVTVLYCSALHCTARYCTALHCTVPALHCTALHCTTIPPKLCSLQGQAVVSGQNYLFISPLVHYSLLS
jgi:hypothetical protein